MQDINYYPYGGVEQDYCGTVGQHYKFTGKERDSESDLDNFGARYYGSFMGRFMTPDDGSDQDAADPQSWNLYGYVRNNPLSNIDPTGNACVRDEGPNGLGPWHDDNSGGETCAQVVANNAITGPSVRVHDTDDDVPYQLANGVANLTTTSSLSEVGVKGITGAQAARGIWSLGGAGWDFYTAWRVAKATKEEAAFATELLSISKPNVTDPNLEKVVNELFQPTDQLAGGTGGAVRYEQMTGDLLSPTGHSQEAGELITRVQNLVKQGNLSFHDQQVAREIILDLSSALGK
jgi:RHS repeat-associated protein